MGWLGPDQEVIERLERIERRLDDVDAELGRHRTEENGHAPRIIWRGMTWSQLMGLGLLLILVASEVGLDVVAALIRQMAGG